LSTRRSRAPCRASGGRCSASACCFGAANTFLFAHSIKAIPLSIAYPVFTGVSFALITLAAAFAFSEHLSPVHLIGIGLVMTGIVLVTR
jgi:multidrug transporter EmrE-like cation transporter